MQSVAVVVELRRAVLVQSVYQITHDHHGCAEHVGVFVDEVQHEPAEIALRCFARGLKKVQIGAGNVTVTSKIFGSTKLFSHPICAEVGMRKSGFDSVDGGLAKIDNLIDRGMVKYFIMSR